MVSVELISCSQTNDVRSFANIIEKLLGELNDICISTEGEENSDIIMSLNESTALSSFQNGLRPSLRTIVKSRDPEDLATAINIAIEEESSYKPTVPSKNSITCSFCKKIGHHVNNCFKKNRTNRNNQNNSSSKLNSNISNFHSNHGSNNSQNSVSYSNKHFQSSDQTKSNFQNQGNQNYTSNIHNTSVICSYCKNSDHIFQNCWKRKFKSLQRSLNNNPNEQTNNYSQEVASNSNQDASCSENSKRTQQGLSTPVRVHNLSA